MWSDRVVGQIGKINGCRVIGVAGSDEKCSYVVDELGFDAAINYKSQDVPSEFQRLCPDGIDVYFDNVGGPVTDAVFENWHSADELLYVARLPITVQFHPLQDPETWGFC